MGFIYPRVLIVSAVPVNMQSATGITLTNLFADWPLAQLAQIYDAETTPSLLSVSNFTRFTSNDVPLVRFLKNTIGKFRRSKSLTNPSSVNATTVTAINNSLLGSYSDILPITLPEELLKWVEEFKPDIIYSVLGSVRMMNIVLSLANKYSIPIVPHFMDDWPGTIYRGSILLELPRQVVSHKLRAVLARAPAKLTICDGMSVEFSKRYGGAFQSFMNCVEIDGLTQAPEYESHTYIKFAYIGGLHLNRWSSLIVVVTALQVLKDRGVNLGIEIYAPTQDLQRYGSLFERFSVVKTISTMVGSEVNRRLREFDVLVHVESFEPEDALYTRYSISTKIPQYMASGRPILVHGPSDLCSVQYVSQCGAGLSVTNVSDVDGLVYAASELCGSASLRREIGHRGWVVASTKHNAAAERMRFALCIAQSIKDYKYPKNGYA